MRKYLFLIAMALGMLSCKSPELERPGVPISWGMRLNWEKDEAQINPNLSKMRELAMRNLMLELPLKADSAGMPKVSIDVPRETTGLLSTYRNKLQLAFCNTNEAELFPQGLPENIEAWFAALQNEIERNLSMLALTLPERVIIGGELAPVAAQDNAWKNMLDALRRKYPSIKFSIGARLDLFDDTHLATLSDELAIDYTPLVGEVLKAESRTENLRIADIALRAKRPVFIYRANLIGEEQLLQLKNRLRFWPEDVQLAGLCINSLYATIPARDDHAYYGLADDQEVLDFLEAYRRATFTDGEE